MGDNADSVSEVAHCPTCLIIRIRDISQKAVLKPWGESSPIGPDHDESELVSYSRPFEVENARHPTLSYQAALELFHSNPSRNLGEDTSICRLCDHWINGLFTRKWEPKDPIARIALGTFKDLEARFNCHICRLLCETISQSPSELDDTRTLTLELSGDSDVKSCGFRAKAVILYKDVEEFPHITYVWETECPRFTFLDNIDIKPDFAKSQTNWDRLRL